MKNLILSFGVILALSAPAFANDYDASAALTVDENTVVVTDPGFTKEYTTEDTAYNDDTLPGKDVIKLTESSQEEDEIIRRERRLDDTDYFVRNTRDDQRAGFVYGQRGLSYGNFTEE